MIHNLMNIHNIKSIYQLMKINNIDPVIICSILLICEYRLRNIKVEILPEDSPVSNKNG